MAGVFRHEIREARQPASVPKEPLSEEVGEFLLYYGVPSAVLLLAGGWFLIRRALAPVTALTRAAERIHAHNLKERLPSLGRGDELDRLTQVFNAMMGRLEESFAHIREFTLHASHELKTPLTVMRGELESTLHDETWTPAQRDLVVSQLDEIQRLTKIVDGLTLLAKADAGQVQMAREPVRLDELVHDSVADALILARPRSVSVTLGDCDEVLVRGDRHRLRQLLLNLTDNAIKYNHEAGRVDLSLKRIGVAAELTISNTGPGISPQLVPRVFDRFFRGDPSRSSAIDGCGLGLSIAQWIVKAHDGKIGIESGPDAVTKVIVQLPLSA
jgi:signal transduction histidine kinase